MSQKPRKSSKIRPYVEACFRLTRLCGSLIQPNSAQKFAQRHHLERVDPETGKPGIADEVIESMAAAWLASGGRTWTLAPRRQIEPWPEPKDAA
jgi:hypothetical protein